MNDRHFDELATRFAEKIYGGAKGAIRLAVLQADLAEALHVSVNRITQLANGEAGKGGLAQKLPGFEIDEITDTMRLDEDGRSRSVRKTVYSLKGYNQLEGFDGVVRLLDEPIARDEDKPGKDGVSEGVRIDESKKTDRSRGGVEREERESKDSKEKERPKKNKSSSQENSNNISLSYPGENPYPGKESIAEDQKGDLTGKVPEPNEPKQKAADSENEAYTDETRIRSACKMEFGINGSVDERKVALKIKLPVEAVHAWLEANYKKTDSGRYRQ